MIHDIIILDWRGKSLEKNVKGRVHSIESFGAVDGPGIRFILFLQGCPLHCKFCHNPDSWDCAYGKQMDSDYVIQEILAYRNFIKTGGVTISGGEPLLQHEFVKAVLDGCREHGIHTAIDTSGAVPLHICKDAVDAADMLLLDIKDIDTEDCKKLTGMGNENAFALLDYCEQIEKPVWIRHVVVPTLTLNWDKLDRLAKRLSHYHCIEKVEPLPFHKMGEYKWEALNRTYELGDIKPPTREEMKRVQDIFRSYGFNLS